MSIPVLKVEIAFDDEPRTANGDATWVDVSSYVRGETQTDMGRQHELDEVQPGTASVTLLNSDRRFDPANGASPYAGLLLPMKKIRIQATLAGTDYPLFCGFIERWEWDNDSSIVDSHVTLRCIDGFKVLSLMRVTVSGNRAQEFTGDRIGAILDSIVKAPSDPLWPSADRALASGAIDVPEMPIDESALSHIQRVAQAEGGLFYISARGNAVFLSRTWRSGASSLATWGDDASGTELRYAELILSYDDSTIWNQIRITRTNGGIEQTAVDQDSVDAYYVRELQRSDVLVVDDSEALAIAKELLRRYREPTIRPKTLIIKPYDDTTACQQALTATLSDKITITRRFLVDGDTLTLDAFIEAKSAHVIGDDWTFTLQLSPDWTLSDTSTATVNTTDDWLAVDYLDASSVPTGWSDFAGFRAGYRREGNWVYLRGVVDGGVPGDTIFTLPVGYRPGQTTNVNAVASNGPGLAFLHIRDDNGEVSLQGAGAAPWIAIDNTAFRLV